MKGKSFMKWYKSSSKLYTPAILSGGGGGGGEEGEEEGVAWLEVFPFKICRNRIQQ